jgi:type IV secretory pathway TrbD component
MRTSTIHTSLNRKKSIMGVDARVFATESALIGIFMVLQLWLFLLAIPLLHMLARWAHQRDDQMVEASVRYAREKDAWDPWHHPVIVGRRPKGYGKGLPC